MELPDMRPPYTDREQEFIRRVDHLVVSSVKAHGILRTPKGSPLTLVESATSTMAKFDRYEAALRSISASACCDRCNEAKLVAQAALRERFNSRELFDRSFQLAEPRGTTGE